MRQLTLCIDIDGTVTEAYDWLPRANEYFNTQVTQDEITVYEIFKALGVSSEEYDEFYRLCGEALHEETNIRKNVKEVITKFYEMHEVHFVTAREERMRRVTEKWLHQYEIPFDSLSLLGTHNKVEKAKELGCNIFIEDRYENAIQLAKAGFRVLLLDCNYNQGSLSPRITRVKNWVEIRSIIDRYSMETYHYSKVAT